MFWNLNFLQISNAQRDKSLSGGIFSVLLFALVTNTEAVMGTGYMGEVEEE